MFLKKIGQTGSSTLFSLHISSYIKYLSYMFHIVNTLLLFLLGRSILIPTGTLLDLYCLLPPAQRPEGGDSPRPQGPPLSPWGLRLSAEGPWGGGALTSRATAAAAAVGLGPPTDGPYHSRGAGRE